MAATGKELLFNACVTRFNASATLKVLGRKLSMHPQSTKPWTEMLFTNFRTMDTFSDDIEVHSVRFVFHGKYPTIRNATNWLERMTEFFDDYTGMTVTGYTVGGVNREDGDDGPHLVDGVWEAQVDYDIMLHRTTKLPASRGA